MTAPIVLVHGILGFNQITFGNIHIADYFKDIPEALRAKGYTVPTPPQLSRTGGIQERAQELKKYLDTTLPHQRVHLIAHSMGGLDARYMISKLDMANRVISLTTIGTPHLGTLIADHVNAMLPFFTKYTLNSMGISTQGLSDLTRHSCEQFNLSVKDVATVKYFCIAGRFSPTPFDPLHWAHQILKYQETEDNDGLVSVPSATWNGSRIGWENSIWEDCNHFNLVNWDTPLMLSHSISHDIIKDNYIAHCHKLSLLPQHA